MNIGIYQSASALSALERWQETVSQNITGSQITGYRKRTVNFDARAAGELNANSGVRAVEQSSHALFPRAGTGVSFASGDNRPTQRELDVALQGDGFFEVQAADGGRLYTRNGNFHLRPDRTLVTANGLEVLGESGSPISLVADQGPLIVNRDGTLLQGETVIGKLSVQRFPDNSRLVAMRGGFFGASAGLPPEPVEDPDVIQGHLESSNVTPMREMMDLVLVSRAYEANQRIITTMDAQMQKTLDALG